MIAQGRAIQEEFSRQLTQGLSPELGTCLSVIEQNIARLSRQRGQEKGGL